MRKIQHQNYLHDVLCYVKQLEGKNKALEVEVTHLKAMFGVVPVTGELDMHISETIKITRTITVDLSNEIILEGIEKHLKLTADDNIISIRLQIPSGGDYSGMIVETAAFKLIIVVETTKDNKTA